MSLLAPKTIPLFHFTGDYATTSSCPVDMQPDLNPSSGAQSYRRAGPNCARSAKYNLPFFLENMGPRFSEWSVNAHEATPGHHTQVYVLTSFIIIKIRKQICKLFRESISVHSARHTGLYSIHRFRVMQNTSATFAVVLLVGLIVSRTTQRLQRDGRCTLKTRL